MSKTKKYDVINFIGRFAIFHKGHWQTLIQALELAEEVVILLGSSNRAQNIRNPFTPTDREDMIRAVLKDEGIPQKRVKILQISDYPYNDDLWLAEVQATVNAYIMTKYDDPLVGIIGFKRDHTSFYLDLFPQWKTVEVEEVGKINATEIRNAIFETSGYFHFANLGENIKNDLPRAVCKWVEDHYNNDRESLDRLRLEYLHVQKYKKAWENAPYQPTFVTVDAVVIQAGHILLVRRGAMPGEGLWALPGGFVNPNERIVDACIRELIEETKIKVPEGKLRGCIRKKDYFDDPERSLRGRTITFGFHFALDAVAAGLPKVKGSDDAVKAKWIPLSEFKKMERMMFEDHYSVVTTLIGSF